MGILLGSGEFIIAHAIGGRQLGCYRVRRHDAALGFWTSVGRHAKIQSGVMPPHSKEQLESDGKSLFSSRSSQIQKQQVVMNQQLR
jgi:hypothetical protein